MFRVDKKELDAYPKAIQQIEFVGQLKNATDRIVTILTILDKIKESWLKFSQGSVTVLQKIAKYEEARVKLTNSQLNKLKSAARNKTGTTWRITKKNFQYEKQPYELFLTTW